MDSKNTRSGQKSLARAKHDRCRMYRRLHNNETQSAVDRKELLACGRHHCWDLKIEKEEVRRTLETSIGVLSSDRKRLDLGGDINIFDNKSLTLLSIKHKLGFDLRFDFKQWVVCAWDLCSSCRIWCGCIYCIKDRHTWCFAKRDILKKKEDKGTYHSTSVKNLPEYHCELICGGK